MYYKQTEESYDYLEHHGILGQKWGIRRFQNEDGTLTEQGKKRYKKDAEYYAYKSGEQQENARKAKNAIIGNAIVTGITALMAGPYAPMALTVGVVVEATNIGYGLVEKSLSVRNSKIADAKIREIK